MSTKRAQLIVMIAGIVMLVRGIAPQVQGVSANLSAVTHTLQGRVYDGNTGTEPPTSSPIQDVTVSLYCSNNQGQQGTLLRSTTTDSDGWYGLDVYDSDVCDYFNIVETDPDGYTYNGATTVGGNVITANWIEYAYPLDGKTLTGNKFWDEHPVLSGRVYEGDTGTEPPVSVPIEGVTVSLYCSNNQGQQGTLLRSTTTDSDGWYGLDVYNTDLCDYLNIVETDPDAYTYNGATTVGGNVVTANWIEYATPLDGKTLTGNKFWDKTYRTFLPLVLK